jgi:hypothetical protein
VIRAEIFGRTVPANRTMEHTAQRHSINHAVVQAKTNDATRKRKCCKPGGERV